MAANLQSFPTLVKETQSKLEVIKKEIAKVIIGQLALVDRLLIGLLADGHMLLEGVPGVAKTLAANTFTRIIHCEFKRIQFTPDLLPADLMGTTIYNMQDNTFSVQKGPIFTNILLADEINRAPAKVQSALLEAMQEKQVTLGGETYPVPRPFLVLATQNPIEQEGTYPLSEAQTDRFMMKIKIGYPTRQEEKEIVNRMGTLGPLPTVNAVITIEDIFHFRDVVNEIYMDDKVLDYLLNIIEATRSPKQLGIKIEGLLEYGASPRASIALKNAARAKALLAGRYFVTPEDIKNICPDVLRHRLRLSYEAEAQNLTTDDILNRILDSLPVP